MRILRIQYNYRNLAQYIGTDLFRNNIGSNIWIELLMNKIETFQKIHHKKIIISDCRFVNEINAIQEKGGIIITLARTDADLKKITDSTLDDLYKKVDNIILPFISE